LRLINAGKKSVKRDELEIAMQKLSGVAELKAQGESS
jgi:hypothetical protein